MNATKSMLGTSTKHRSKSFKGDIVDAHDIGYALGWDHAYNIPDRLFAKTVAAYGFRKGMRNKFRTDQYAKTYQKKGKNY
jgi:hypothetical protein